MIRCDGAYVGYEGDLRVQNLAIFTLVAQLTYPFDHVEDATRHARVGEGQKPSVSVHR